LALYRKCMFQIGGYNAFLNIFFYSSTLGVIGVAVRETGSTNGGRRLTFQTV